jgi:hypothetical protein
MRLYFDRLRRFAVSVTSGRNPGGPWNVGGFNVCLAKGLMGKFNYCYTVRIEVMGSRFDATWSGWIALQRLVREPLMEEFSVRA